MVVADHQFQSLPWPRGTAIVNRATSGLGPMAFHPPTFAILAPCSAFRLRAFRDVDAYHYSSSRQVTSAWDNHSSSSRMTA